MRILTHLSTGDGARPAGRRLCEVSAEVTAVTGAGIMLMSADLASGTLCTSDDVSAVIEDLQYTLGEGPCLDAHHQGHPVLEPDLADPDHPRWSAFSAPAVVAGVRAVFGFPIRVGVVRLGTLNLYRDAPGSLSDDQYADALVLANVIAWAVLVLLADAPPGAVPAELETEGDFRFVVHQAAGMVSVQLDVSIGEALVRLRAHAFRAERPVTEVAQDVVSRQLRFTDP
jgi:hypothetical protein